MDDFDSNKSVNADYMDLEILRNGSLFDVTIPFDSEDKVIGMNIMNQMIKTYKIKLWVF